MMLQEDHNIEKYNNEMYRCTDCGQIEKSKKAIKTYCCSSILDKIED